MGLKQDIKEATDKASADVKVAKEKTGEKTTDTAEKTKQAIKKL